VSPAYTLATLLSEPSEECDVHQTCAAIEDLFADKTDEAKADLYAMLAESVFPGQSFAAKRTACEIALRRNVMRFPHG
jgi:hypothetical protein